MFESFDHKKLLGHWTDFIMSNCESEYFKLGPKLAQAKKYGEISPSLYRSFAPFRTVSPENLRCLIISHTPYTCSMNTGISLEGFMGGKVPSLLSIVYDEIERSLYSPELLGPGYCPIRDPQLDTWTKQGVLPIQICLTYQKGKRADSHQDVWEEFMCAFVEAVVINLNVVIGVIGPNVSQILKKNTTYPWTSNYNTRMVYAPQIEENSGFVGSDFFLNINRQMSALNYKRVIWMNCTAVGSKIRQYHKQYKKKWRTTRTGKRAMTGKDK